MKSQGTKQTQGVNGDAAALQQQLEKAARATLGDGNPCPFPRHRPTDWVTPISQLTCGICHPAAAEFPGIARRGDDGFDELADAARLRRTARREDQGGAR